VLAEGSDETRVTVEVVELRPGHSRQISPKGRIAQQLRERQSDIEAAIQETAEILNRSLSQPHLESLAVRRIEARFGLTLTTEAGVLISKVGAEASFEITLVLERS
jgi:hypothetical protein